MSSTITVTDDLTWVTFSDESAIECDGSSSCTSEAVAYAVWDHVCCTTRGGGGILTPVCVVHRDRLVKLGRAWDWVFKHAPAPGCGALKRLTGFRPVR